jgi:hypothetical protein
METYLLPWDTDWEEDFNSTQGTICSQTVPSALSFERLSFFQTVYKNVVRTTQEIYYISATKPNLLMLFRETIAVYCENHMKHTNALCGQNAEFSI